jgi:hypothetical protein
MSNFICPKCEHAKFSEYLGQYCHYPASCPYDVSPSQWSEVLKLRHTERIQKIHPAEIHIGND